MLGLFLGIFLLVMCIIMLIFGSGGFGGFLGVGFVLILSLWLIFKELKKKLNDGKTSMQGEKCYARILDCVKTGGFIFNKEEYKVIVAVYVSSLQRTLVLEEVVGFNSFEKYPINSFFSVLYHNNDINIVQRVVENEIPGEILNDLNSETVLQEYNEYKKEEQLRREEGQIPIDDEPIQKASLVIGKVQLIYKRVILGIIIFVLLILVLIDTAIFRQTIIAKDYVETIATYYDHIVDNESSIFSDASYTFKDKQGKQHEIIISVDENYIQHEIKIKYNENNPQDFYEEGATFDKSGVIWYIVKLVVLILSIILFFNKKLLSKLNISSSRSNNVI